jgi:hypothetical protein
MVCNIPFTKGASPIIVAIDSTFGINKFGAIPIN